MGAYNSASGIREARSPPGMARSRLDGMRRRRRRRRRTRRRRRRQKEEEEDQCKPKSY